MYRTLLSFEGPPVTQVRAMAADLERCAAECGWRDGTLMAQALDGCGGLVLARTADGARRTSRLLLQFRDARLRVPDGKRVFLVARGPAAGPWRVLVRAWPHFLTPVRSGPAPWERVFTRVLPLALVEASGGPTMSPADCADDAAQPGFSSITAGLSW
jgi:hypothetical protein